jgi:hypothetical protein
MRILPLIRVLKFEAEILHNVKWPYFIRVGEKKLVKTFTVCHLYGKQIGLGSFTDYSPPNGMPLDGRSIRRTSPPNIGIEILKIINVKDAKPPAIVYSHSSENVWIYYIWREFGTKWKNKNEIDFFGASSK